MSLFLVAVAIRAMPYDGVFFGGHVQFFGNDAYYHMRRVLYSLYQFPSVLDFDPYINFPSGAQPIWTPFFDWLIAFLLLPLRGHPVQELEAAAAWVPSLLGGATVVALYVIARRHFGSGVALIAGFALALSSGHFWYSQLGFVDHHSAVALVTTLLLGASMKLVERASASPSRLGFIDRYAVTSGLAVGAALLTWPGTLLHVGLIEVALLACLLTRRGRQDSIQLAVALSVMHVVAFCLIAPFSLGASWDQWSDFSPVVLSNFQPWYLAAASFFSVGCAALWRRAESVGAHSLWRAVSALVLGAGLVSVSLVLWQGLLDGAFDAWEWLSRGERFQAMVAESLPIFIRGGELSVQTVFVKLSAFALLAPVFLVIGAWTAYRDGRWAPGLLIWWTLGLCMATLAQRRFFNTSSVALALLLALSLRWTYRAITSRLASPSIEPADVSEAAGRVTRSGGRDTSRSALVAGGLAALTLALLYPTLDTYRPYLVSLSSFVGKGGARPLKRPGVVYQFAACEMARWLERNTPKTQGWLDASARPEYGILAPWGRGHVIEYLGRRPTVTNNFGDDIGAEGFELAQRYYHAQEAEAAKILDDLRARYVIVQSTQNFLAKNPGRKSIYSSLNLFDGSLVGPENAGSRFKLPAARRHRLVYESRRPPGKPDEPPWFKVFEYVRGARIEGRAGPGREVRLELPVRTNRKREFSYVASARADEQGRYVFLVPYANNKLAGSVISAAESYSVECGQDRETVVVRDAAVQQGGVVTGPDLCL